MNVAHKDQKQLYKQNVKTIDSTTECNIMIDCNTTNNIANIQKETRGATVTQKKEHVIRT